MGRTPDWAETPQVSSILTGGKHALRTVGTVDPGSSSQHMDKDLAKAHGLPCYPMHTSDTVFVIDGPPAGTLTNYTVAYVVVIEARSCST